MIPVPHGSCKDCELNNPTSDHHRIEENQLLIGFQCFFHHFRTSPKWVLKPFWRGSELYLMMKPHGLSSHQPGQQLRMCCGWMVALWNLVTSAPWHCFTTALCPLRGPPRWLQAGGESPAKRWSTWWVMSNKPRKVLVQRNVMGFKRTFHLKGHPTDHKWLKIIGKGLLYMESATTWWFTRQAHETFAK